MHHHRWREPVVAIYGAGMPVQITRCRCGRHRSQDTMGRVLTYDVAAGVPSRIHVHRRFGLVA